MLRLDTDATCHSQTVYILLNNLASQQKAIKMSGRQHTTYTKDGRQQDAQDISQREVWKQQVQSVVFIHLIGVLMWPHSAKATRTLLISKHDNSVVMGDVDISAMLI